MIIIQTQNMFWRVDIFLEIMLLVCQFIKLGEIDMPYHMFPLRKCRA